MEMSPIDDFHSMNRFLHEQIHCRRAQKRIFLKSAKSSQQSSQQSQQHLIPTLSQRASLKNLKSIKSYQNLADLQKNENSQALRQNIAAKISLKIIIQRVESYIKQYKNLSTDLKTEHLREVKIIKSRFKKVLEADRRLHRNRRQIVNNTIYRSFFKIKASRIEKCIKTSFSDVLVLPSFVRFDPFLLSEEQTQQQHSASQDRQDHQDIFRDTSNFISMELNKVFKKFQLSYNPLKHDIDEAINYALRDNNGMPFSLAIKAYLLQIIEEKYSPMAEPFTVKQLDDARSQLQEAHLYVLLFRDKYQPEHDYMEYDEKSLREAIKAAFFTSKSSSHDAQSSESNQPVYYPVIRYRMPGFKANQTDYEQLKLTVSAFLEDSNVMKDLEDVLPLLLAAHAMQTQATNAPESDSVMREPPEIEIKTPD